jgi:hypothetical protein
MRLRRPDEQQRSNDRARLHTPSGHRKRECKPLDRLVSRRTASGHFAHQGTPQPPHRPSKLATLPPPVSPPPVSPPRVPRTRFRSAVSSRAGKGYAETLSPTSRSYGRRHLAAINHPATDILRKAIAPLIGAAFAARTALSSAATDGERRTPRVSPAPRVTTIR